VARPAVPQVVPALRPRSGCAGAGFSALRPGWIRNREETGMLVVYIASFAFALLVIDSVVVAIVHRRVLGKFEVVSDWGRMLAFRSDTGSFRARSDLQRLEYAMNGMSAAVGFEDIDRLEFSVVPEDAGLLQLMLDMDLDEHWRRERDHVDWHSISVVLRTGEKIPLFRSGEYHRIKYFHGLYTEVQLSCLESLGLRVDVRRQSREVLAELRDRLGSPKVDHRIDRW
jgi:hypothetical protein